MKKKIDKTTHIDPSQIIRNPNTNIEYNIKRIKKERRYTAILVCIFIVVILSVSYFVFTKINSINLRSVNTKNLTTIYELNKNGLNNIINITNKNTKLNYHFTIRNNSDNNINYYIYLDDDTSFIKYDNCKDNIVDYNKLLFSINNSEYNSLLSVKDKLRKYVVYEDTIHGKSTKKITLKIKYSDEVETNNHYHGLINVAEMDE